MVCRRLSPPGTVSPVLGPAADNEAPHGAGIARSPAPPWHTRLTACFSFHQPIK